MKNLKKVLALVLAFACAFTMFAGAAFTDSADVSQTEAVDMLTALGVIDGYEDGSFRPDVTVTRAEMAKMIYTIRTGSSDASAYNNDATTFTDITSHWARGYIKYCQSLGIIAGKSTTSFDPDADVTTQEAAKMLLVTLGYDAEKAGLEGVSWGAKTTALADENGLLKDVNNGTTQGLPRQYAAQLMYNAIFANTVMLRDGEYTKYGYDNSLNKTIGEKYMDLVKVSAGVLYKCNLVDGKDYYTIGTDAGTYNKVPSDVSDLIGQEVEVLRKVNASEATVYGVYADDDSKVVATGYASQLEADGDKIKLNGTSYKADKAHGTASVYNINVDSAAMVTMNTLFTAAAKGTVTADTAATAIKLIDNDGNGKVDLSVQTPAKVAKVTAVATSSITVRYLATSTTATIKFDDAEIYDGVAKDDYVTIIDDANRSVDKDLVTKMDVTNAVAEATRTDEVKVDGTWYKTANTVTLPTTGNTYDFVITGGVVVDATEVEGSASNIAYVSGIEKTAGNTWADNNNELTLSIGETTGTLKVRMYFQDGTDKEVKVSKINGKKIRDVAGSDDAYNAAQTYADVDDLDPQTMVTYSELSDGTYDVKKIDDTVGYKNVVGMDYTTTSGTVYANQKISGTAVADDAVVFVQTQKETKVLTGKQVNNWANTVTPTFEIGEQMLTKATNGIDYVKFAVLWDNAATSIPGATKDTLYAYLTSNPYEATVNGEKKGAYNVWTGTENTVLYVDASGVPATGTSGQVISYTVNGDYIESVAVVGKVTTGTVTGSTNLAAVTGIDGGRISYRDNTNTQRTYDLDDDCVFIAVNSNDEVGMADVAATADSVRLANEVSDGINDYYVPNAFIVYKVDGTDVTVVAVIFDANDTELVDYSVVAPLNTTMLVNKTAGVMPS